MSDSPFDIDGDVWRRLNQEKRELRQSMTAGTTVEEKLRCGQRLSAQAAAVRRSIIRDERAQPVDPQPDPDG